MVSQYRVGSLLGVGDRFEIVSKLGQGTFGAVYLCKDRVENLDRALKVETHGDVLQNEYNNYKLLRSSPAVPTYIGRHFQDSPFFIALSVEGESWASIQSKSSHRIVSGKRLLSLFFHAIVALRSIHEAGVLHADLRPANICLSATPGKLLVVLIDFGLGLRVQVGKNGRRKYPRALIPQLAFASARVCKGERMQELDELFSLCLVCLAMRKAWSYYSAPLAKQIEKKEALFTNPERFLNDSEQALAPIFEAVNEQSYSGMPQYEQITNIFYTIDGFDADYCKRPIKMH